MKVLTRLILVVLVAGLMEAARLVGPAQDPRTAASALVLAVGFVLIVGWAISRAFEAVGLPRLTGYMVTGIVSGPFVLAYLDSQAVEGLASVNGVAVALIALTAGSEIQLAAMRPLARSVGAISLIGVAGSALVLAVVAYAMRSSLPFLSGIPDAEARVVAVIIGIVVASGSPAVVVAIRAETSADGPVARTVLGVVVLADLLVIVLFAAASSVARALVAGSLDADATLRALAWELFGSMGVGVVVGALLGLGLRLLRQSGGVELFVLACSLVVAEIGRRVHLDPLLVMLSAGMLVENVAHAGESLRRSYEDASLPVFVVFFTVVGASIRLDLLPLVIVPAAVLVVVRAIGLLGGARVAARLAEAPPQVTSWAGFGLLPQAGLANALAILVARTFPGYGEGTSSLLLGIVAINALVMPALFRIALVRSGEVRA